MSTAAASVLVSDPGRRPDLFYAAKGIAAAGVLRMYATPVAFPGDHRLLRSESRIGPLRRLQRLAKLRGLPPEFRASRVKHIEASRELLMLAARQFGPLRGAVPQLMTARNRAFDRRFSQLIENDDTMIMASYTAAEQSLRSATRLGVDTMLSYPIAHHRWATQILAEEAELQPQFAETLQFVDAPTAVLEQLERELDLAGHIHCLCNFHARTMAESGIPESKLTTAPLGVDLDLFQPRRNQRTRDRGRTTIMFVGQITQRKGLSYLIDGFERAAVPGSELVLVGKPIGPTTAWLGRPGVRHIPHVSRSELPALYATADLFVMPSLVEGFCLTALEAMACGVPVAATAHTFVGDELLRDGAAGWTLPIRDPDAIAECITRVAERDFEWEAMSTAAQAAARQYGWERYERQMAQIAIGFAGGSGSSEGVTR